MISRLFKILKWSGILVLVIITGLVIIIYATWQKKFDAPYPNIHSSTDSSIIAHGEYLVYGPAHCAECHLEPKDMAAFLRGEKTPLSGGFEYKLDIGSIYSPNITPDKETGIGKYSDAEIARWIRHQVKPNGTTQLPFMEYQNLSDADLTAIISYLRSIPPIKHQVPTPQLNLLGKGVMAFLIKPQSPLTNPPEKVEPAVTAKYGEYLADAVSNCKSCHTQRNMMTGEYTGIPFGGGLKMEATTGEKGVYIVSPNISTDKQAGRLGYWDEQRFVERFHQGTLIKETNMPWASFKRYSDDDLRAIYLYLATLPPVDVDPGPVLIRETK